MKRPITLLLALSLALLTSCELMAPAPTQRPSIGLPGEPAPTETADPVPSRMPWQEGVGPDADRRFSQIGVTICATENSVYFNMLGDQLIRYADKATGICLPLCGKPECTHNNDNCNAYLYSVSIYGLSCYNDRLYWIDVNPKNWLEECIYSMAYDGTDRRTERSLGVAGGFLEAQFHRGYLYVSYRTQEVVNAEAKDTLHVVAYRLGSDEGPVEILNEEVRNLSQQIRIQAFGDIVYIALKANEDGSDIELYRWDTQIGELETLFCGDIPFFWRKEFWATEEGIMLYGNVPTGPEGNPWASQEYNIYRFSFESGEIEQVYQFWEGENVNIFASDGVFVGNMLTEAKGNRFLVKDFAGRTVLDTTFEDIDWYDSPGLMSGIGMDESYLYFTKYSKLFIAVSRDGSEIRLLWTNDVWS